jgi:hypothetical protein
MNFSELWPLLANISAESERGKRLSLKVIFSERKQALLVPIDMQQAHDAVRFFINNPILAYWGHLLIKLDHYLPLLRLLPTVEFENFPLETLFGSNDSDKALEPQGIAIFCGSPGPLQKITIHYPDAAGGLGKVAKVAVHETANEAIQKEVHWLEKLNKSAEIARFLPKLLQHSVLNHQRHCLTMMSLAEGISPKTFGIAHHAFLRALAKQKPVFSEWKNSEAHLRLKLRINSLASIVNADVSKLWHEVISEIELQTARAILPNLMIHGDFATWNLRQINADLFVFDWEYAQTHGNPLQDYLHFHLIPQALKRDDLTDTVMPAILKKTMAYADKQYGKDTGIGKAAGPLTLHYLLDTITFYTEASGYLDEHHPVLQCYTSLLQQRAQWLSKMTPLPSTKSVEHPRYDNELEIS